MPKTDQKGIAHLLLLIPLIAGIILGVYLINQKTNLFPRAASGPVSGPIVTPSPNSNYPGKLSLSPTSGSVAPGCIVPVSVGFDTGGKDTPGVETIINFDPNLVSVNQIKEGEIFFDHISSTDNGTVSLAGIGYANNRYNGKGVLGIIEFKVNPNAQTGKKVDITFDFDPNDLENTIDSNMPNIDTVTELLGSVVNSSFIVGEGSACQDLSPMKPGDTDGDNDVDIFDYNIVLTDFGKNILPGKPADFDKDGDVDIFDYNIILTYFGT